MFLRLRVKGHKKKIIDEFLRLKLKDFKQRLIEIIWGIASLKGSV